MQENNRPEPINEILENLIDEDKEMGVDLKVYVTHLESNQPKRPEHIQIILKQLVDQVPATAETLQRYLHLLETNQVCQYDETTTSEADEISPAWSYEREMQRKRRRQERAERKRQGYPGIKQL